MTPVKTIVICIVLVILVMIVAFFSSSETAYLSLRKLKLRRMIVEKKPHARLVSRLKENMDTLLTTVLIGTNLVNSLASSLATVLAIEIVGNGGVGIATLVISFFITVFGQIVPKTIAARYPEKMCSSSSVPLSIIEKIFFPVIWIFSGISHFAVFIAEKLMKPMPAGVTEEEIQTLIDVGESEGTLEKDESRMLNKIFSFDDILVKDIMRHRSFIRSVNVSASQSEVVQVFLDSGFSNLAVFDESGDSKTEIVGVINYKSVLYNQSQDENEPYYAKKLMAPVVFVPQTMSVYELLKDFRKLSRKYAIALDEQGATGGIVSIKDIMRVVLGRMSDESGIEEIPAENRIKVASSNDFLIPGDMKLEDMNNLFGTKLESDFSQTLGGWVLEQFGHLPSVGEIMIYGKTLFIVEDINQRRIITVRVKIR